uniref:Glucose-methanol-choline oxidoreductase N-terminal domain-containing protein n=1 Tax=Fagus sylvatica TaxID=28930 RepID=A0A2N9FJG4_FAGSY
MGFGCWRFICTFLTGILFFHSFCYSEKAPNYSFLLKATSAPANAHYDYIIIGGGTASCALAATLSQGANVLVLERGGSPYDNPKVTDVGSYITTLTDTSLSSPFQHFVSQDGVINARPRILGGGSALNAGFYTRASASYIKEAGWNETLVNESYQWAEKLVAFKPPMLQWQSAVRDGLLEAGVLPDNGFTYDHLYGTKAGGIIFDKDGHRHCAADLLEYADPTKIKVYLHATVHNILFKSNNGSPKPQAYGVIFTDALGTKHTAYLNNNLMNEIILSAGAIGSPQLLMLSGIGPVEELQAQGIKVVLDQPMVGQDMADNPMNFVFVPSPNPVEVSLIQVVGITKSDSYIEAASGLSIGSSWAQKISGSILKFLLKTGLASEVLLEMVLAAGNVNKTIRGGVIVQKTNGPISKGNLKLLSTNPNLNPSVTFNYYKEPEDLKKCVDGMKTIMSVISSEAFSKFRYGQIPVQALMELMLYLPVNMRKKHLSASFSLEQFCIDTVTTIWHYHGGCQVGKVVDTNYRVLGVDALRVIDGSTFNSSPGTNPQATVMMLGRYMGQKILQERLSNNGKPQLLFFTSHSHIQSNKESYMLGKRYFKIWSWKTDQPFTVPPEAMAEAAETINAIANGTIKGGLILEKVIGPLSTGHLELQNTNPNDNPSVTFNYFKEPKDLKRCVKGLSTVIDVINSYAFSKFRYSNMTVQALTKLMLSFPVNMRPRHANATISLKQFCIDTVVIIWHYHGGCQVGKVVDRDYKVVGVVALRVIDGSMFLRSPGTNPQATVMMLGRYMGEKILHERYSHERK